MCRIEALIVLSVTSFHLTIMSGRKETDQLVPDSMLHETNLKNSRLIRTTIGTETFGEFLLIVSLDTFYRTWESPDKMFQK